MSDALRIQLFQSGVLPFALLFLMLLMVEIGWRTGRASLARRQAAMPGGKYVVGDTALLGSIFGLLALLIAFTFSGAAGRFETHRQLIAKEASAIGTAYRLVDQLPRQEQAKIRELFQRYVDHRIGYYTGSLDPQTLEERSRQQAQLGDALWQAALRAVRDTQSPDRGLAEKVLPGLLDMLDSFDNERVATKSHPPRIIWLSLLVLALIGSFMSGYKMGFEEDRDWLITVIFAVLMSGAVYLILNLEYPRIGSVDLHDFDHELVNLRKAM
jgi:hypothetical protein